MKSSSNDRWVTYLVSVTVAALVLLFGLQRFGIWQPAEVRVADMAREVIAHQPIPNLDRPPGQISAVAVGFRVGGVSELWGRLPTALLAFLALASLMGAARATGDRRLAAYTGITYATLPLVFMNARQMFGGGAAQSAITLALAGAAMLLWGRERKWQGVGAASLLAGTFLSVQCAGVMLGVVPVLGAAGVAVLLRFGRERRDTRVLGAAAFVAAAVLAVMAFMAASKTLTGYSAWVGASDRSQPAAGWQTFEYYFEQLAHATFPWTGLIPFGLVRLVSPPSKLAREDSDPNLDADEVAELDAWRESGLRLMAFVAIALGFAVQTFHMQVYGPTPFYVVAPLALGLAVLLRDCEREEQPWRTVAVAGALLTALMLRDYLQFPKSAYAALGLPDGGPAFPSGFQIKFSEWMQNVKAARAAGGEVPPMPAEGYHLISTALYLGLSVLVLFQGAGEIKPISAERPWQWIQETERDARDACADEMKSLGRATFGSILLANFRWLLAAVGIALFIVGASTRSIPALTTPGRNALTLVMLLPVLAVAAVYGILALWNAYAWIGAPKNPVNKALGSRVAWVGVAGVIVALIYAHAFVPALSEHMSPRGVWAVVRALRHGNEPVGRFGGPGEDPATRYYTSVQPQTITSEEDAVAWLTGSQRSFLVVGADVFGSLNRAYRASRHQNIPVADATNSNLLLAVSDLEGRASRNPLDAWVLSQRPNMRHPAREPCRLGEASRNEDLIEFIGYDLDSGGKDHVPLGGSFKVTFNFHVLRESQRNWQVFVHTDGQGPRINGDHDPVNGKYPVRLWVAGDYIRDQITINIPLTYRPGIYTVYMGFFDGGDRMRTEGGDHDRENRVIAARVNVR